MLESLKGDDPREVSNGAEGTRIEFKCHGWAGFALAAHPGQETEIWWMMYSCEAAHEFFISAFEH